MVVSNVFVLVLLLVNMGQGLLLLFFVVIVEISREIVFEVGRVVMEQGFVFEMFDDVLCVSIECNFWKVEYCFYKWVSIQYLLML